MKEYLKNLYQFVHSRFQTVHLDYPVKFEPRFGHGKPAHPELLAQIERSDYKYKELLKKGCNYGIEFLLQIQENSSPESPFRPYWNNGFSLAWML